jgi:hypothetical protein
MIVITIDVQNTIKTQLQKDIITPTQLTIPIIIISSKDY